MKLQIPNRKTAALTLIEALVVIGIMVLLAAILLPALAAAKKKSSKISCTNLLKQIGLAYYIWAGDNWDKFPTEVSVTNGGAMELAVLGDAVAVFQVMSNELSTPKVLFCPNDTEEVLWATNFGPALTSKNVSYFVGLVSHTNSPQAFLSGDDNFQVGGVPVRSGLLEISSSTPIKWTSERHKFVGNIGFADGSVQPATSSGITNLLTQTGLATNRLAIP
jgi:prepilin-type processing-associated H-X9-DG protein